MIALNELYKKTQCQCSKLPILSHELTQSLMIINAYISGCNERIKKNTININEIVDVLNKMNKQVELISQRLQGLA